MKTTRLSIVALLFIFFLTGCPLMTVPPEQNQNQHLTFIGTADLQGRLNHTPDPTRSMGKGEPPQVVGGITRIATIIKRITEEVARQPNHSLTVLTSGDDLMGRYFQTFAGKAIVELMGLAGYELMALGNHEFDRGPGILGEALEQAEFTTLCSDLTSAGTALEGACQPLVIKRYGPVRVGFFSLITPEFAHVTNGGNVSLQDSTFVAARKFVATLKKKDVDLVVAMTHLGLNLDRQLATEVAGIDLIFGGHSHDYLPEPEQVGSTLIVNGGEKGTNVVRLDLVVDKEKKIIPGSVNYSLLPVVESIPEDPITLKRLQYYMAQMPGSVVLGKTDVVWHLDKESLRSGESSVANLVNDLILKKFQVDLVLNNGGAFRGNKHYPAGPVTDTMLHEIDAFENDIYLVQIKGKYLREILEHSATLLGQGGFLQLGGLKIVINPSKQPQEILQSGTDWKITSPGQRIVDVSIRNSDGSLSPLDPEEDYRIATNSFLAHKGGDRYFWFQQYGHGAKNTYTSLYSLMAMELAQTKILNPPKPDGRIRLTPEELP